MADLADVEIAIQDLLVSNLLADGSDQHVLLGVTCRIYRGWPSPRGLNADLGAGVVNVTVFPDATMGKTTTRFFDTWYVSQMPPGLAVTVDADAITISGTATVGQTIGIIVDNKTYAYRVRAGDTAGIIASEIASLVRVDRIVNYAGGGFMVPGAFSVRARVVAEGVVRQEVRRQERDIRVSCWCSSPLQRDHIASGIDGVMAARTFITLADDTAARIIYAGSQVFDTSQNALLYRRDLLYTVEYPTVTSTGAPAMLFGDMHLNSSDLIA